MKQQKSLKEAHLVVETPPPIVDVPKEKEHAQKMASQGFSDYLIRFFLNG